ncbi:MAG TPA: exonuclease [Candidatus Margulisbacteria bacterium]|nr:MAG: exonuclease [Candidatus Margulisbacteria bacterium GWD2_39_127]OGI03224.1 MAG: exonuclease [Candidatus Margulisbacteria bacterium GWF2_38_17]OGI11248.1 MAG: exonuclease [Candidatus Margulisbacteria bacterium GWE2_39_32]HAR63900.1 exonuclease [Candidatus Margulisiibacteriota bacterium]HCT85863.1 exonuclease [Candidatus Margulisiibacteriota bacterium]
MLINTFCHIPKISVNSEQKIWDSGVLSWNDLNTDTGKKLPFSRREKLANYTQESMNHLKNDNPVYFYEQLPKQLHWRLFPHFRKSVAYIDIETSGLYCDANYITSISLYDGKDIYCYVKGQNLEDFLTDIQRYNLIVTYNGKCFDVPFIENYFKTKLPKAHIDLRYIMHNLGYKGGLKGCEKQLGLDRKELDGVDGYFAVLLWQDYQVNDNKKALETLLAYNIMDVVNLEVLMVMAYNLNLEKTPFHQTHLIPRPILPEIPYHADIPTIEKIKRRLR